MKQLPLLIVCLWSIGLSAAYAQQTRSVTTDCLVRVHEEIKVPASREGLVAKLHVRRGSEVQAGQELLLLDQTDALLQRAAAEAEYERAVALAANEGRLRAAEAATQLAQTESRLIKQLGQDAVFLERARIESALARSDADLLTARGDLEQSRKSVQIRKAEFDLAQREVDDRLIAAPLAGVVREISRQQGEWVRRGDTVLTITRLDRLLVEAFVDSSTVPPHKISGATATARLEIAEGQSIELKNLRLEFTAPRLELDGKYLVWVEIDNLKRPDQANHPQWVLRPGMRGRLEINYNPATP